MSTSNFSRGTPGIGSPLAVSFGLLALNGGYQYRPVGGLIKGSKARDVGNTDDPYTLRTGLIMAKHTSDGTFAPWVCGVSANALTTSGTTITVSPAEAVEIVRRLGASSGAGTLTIVGPPSANGTAVAQALTFSAINTATGAITITATGVAYVAGSLIVETAYGIPLTFINEDQVSLPPTGDADWPRIAMTATINVDKILYWPTDTGIKTYIRANMSTTAGNKFVFSDSI